MSANGTLRILLVTALLPGCGHLKTPDYYADGISSFAKGSEAAEKIVSENLDSAATVRRTLAVQYYLAHPNSDLNLSSTSPQPSFASFACAGLSEYVVERQTVEFVGRYRSTLESVAKAPDDDVVSIWTNIKELNEPRKPLGLPSPIETGATACRKEVERLLALPPVPLLDPQREGLVALAAGWEAVSALYDAIKTVITDASKLVEERERAIAIKKLIKQNEEVVKKVLESPELSASLASNWDRRRMAMLLLPFERFRRLLELNPASQRAEIVGLAIEVNTALEPFDEIRLRKSPQDIFAAVRGAQTKLVELADAKVTAKEAAAYLKAFAKELAKIKDDIDDVKSKWKDVEDAT
jgi:hypothetical protein